MFSGGHRQKQQIHYGMKLSITITTCIRSKNAYYINYIYIYVYIYININDSVYFSLHAQTARINKYIIDMYMRRHKHRHRHTHTQTQTQTQTQHKRAHRHQHHQSVSQPKAMAYLVSCCKSVIIDNDDMSAQLF